MVMKFVKLYWVVYKYIVQMDSLSDDSSLPPPPIPFSSFFSLDVQCAPCKRCCCCYFTFTFIIMGPEGENENFFFST